MKREKMKKILTFSLLLLAGSAYAATAYFSHEIDTGGMTKQCVYTYLGNTYTITVKSYQLCPMSIQVSL